MTARSRAGRSAATIYLAAGAALLLLGACGRAGGDARPAARSEALVIGAVPDQEPQELQRLYAVVADYLSEELDVPVAYLPVTDYTAAVSLFKVGDLDLVWFGGLTGVQARLQVDGADAIAQRDIDARFRSVFIVHSSTGLAPAEDVAGLSGLRGLRFTFGSESSTSGRLMPQHYLDRAGVRLDDFEGDPGFSGDHDKTIDLVEAGTFQAGVVNEQVWDARVDAGEVDLDKVKVFFRTPAYPDYHWVVRPDVDDRFGDGFAAKIEAALTGLDPSDRRQARILELFGAGRFIPTDNGNYRTIERVARDAGLLQ